MCQLWTIVQLLQAWLSWLRLWLLPADAAVILWLAIQMTADGKRRKAFAEYKLIFPSASDTVDHLQHTMVFGSVRSQTLQKLMFINFMVVEPRSPLHQELAKIHNECNLSRAKRSEDLEAKDLVYYLKPEHVMNLIGCNKRTAVEYVEVIKSFYTLPMFLSSEVNRRQLEDEGSHIMTNTQGLHRCESIIQQ